MRVDGIDIGERDRAEGASASATDRTDVVEPELLLPLLNAKLSSVELSVATIGVVRVSGVKPSLVPATADQDATVAPSTGSIPTGRCHYHRSAEVDDIGHARSRGKRLAQA